MARKSQGSARRRARRPASGRAAVPERLARLRSRMDRVNAGLVRGLQERARLARAIAKLKRELGLRAADPRREREMLARALAEAPEGFPRRELTALLRAVFAASRALVERELRSPSRGK